MAIATFGAGCFWGVEAAFRKIPGVTATRVGYMGGIVNNPTYEDVCTDQTGHAEVVEVGFDDSKISFRFLLRAFFSLHDPTQINRQGPDVGSQYRSVIFYHSPDQQQEAEQIKAELQASGRFPRPIATQVVPAGIFWEAEDYHQQYLEKRGLVSCHLPEY